MSSHIFLFGSLPRRRPSDFTAILRWLDWVVLKGYLPSLSITYVAMSKDMEKRLPQLYYIKIKISYDLGFIKWKQLTINKTKA